ncbi:MAG TPA: PilN domain-containing protein [Terriglobia bacterium]|nr:PilN domain-containing protein [Terriglobia bacterium]
MIRINLLPEGMKRAAVAAPGVGPAWAVSPVLVLGASALASFVLVGGLAWFWSARGARFERQVKREQAEQARLAAIEKENKVYARQVEELEQRVQTIRALESSRSGPVELMSALGDTVSRTRDVYLVSVGPDGGRLLVKGQAGSVGSIASLITAMQRSGRFSEIELGQYYQDDQSERLTFKFDLHCVYQAGGEAAGQPKAPGAVAPSSAARVKS